MISDKCDNRNMCDPECPDSSRTLGIIHEFRKLYEDKMSIIDAEGSGDCNLQAKLSLQHDWIRDLNEQNEMLVRSVEELEQEATERVVALEEKLRQSSKCASEQVAVMQEDIITLVEFIKRSYEDRTWNIPQLKLNTVHIDTNANDFNGHDDLQVSADQQVNIMDKLEHKLVLKDANIKMLQGKLDDALQSKEKIAAEIPKECIKCAEVRQSMMDMRDALTAEVADKHDVILTLKRDVQVLEEQCRKADQQTHFKDDIIKELRKEIKQLKLEMEEKTYNKYCEKNNLKLSHNDNMQKIHRLETDKDDLQKRIHELQAENTKKIATMETLLLQSTPKKSVKESCCMTELIPASVQVDKCIGDCSSSTPKSCQTEQEILKIPICEPKVKFAKSESKPFLDCNSDCSLRAEEMKLEEVVQELQNSVSKMIVSECQMKQDKARILELEQQLSCAWRSKECEVETARTCREEEILNLKQVIDRLKKNLENEKLRSQNLQKAVDLYRETIETMKDSEDKFKQEVVDQKCTIQNLQEALVQTKHNLEDVQQKTNIEYEEHGLLVNKLLAIVTNAEKEIQHYMKQFDEFTAHIENLREENIQLEQTLFYNHQDLEMYEMRLAKYQRLYNQVEARCVSLKKKLRMIEAEKVEKETFVQDLSGHLAECQQELSQLFAVLNEEKIEKEDQSGHIATLQMQLTEESDKLTNALNCLDYEKQQNAKLSHSLKKNQCITNTIRNETIHAHEKLQEAALKIASDEQRILACEQQVNEYQGSLQALHEEQSELKQELEKTQTELTIKCCECVQFNEQIAALQKQFEQDSSEYRNTIKDLDTKNNSLVVNYNQLGQELHDCKLKFAELDKTENKIKQDFIDKETKFYTKINKFQSEQERLIAVITNLEQELAKMNAQLNEKDRTLEMFKANICGQEKLREKHEEIIRLKNEINTLIQTQVILKSENEKLQLQLAHLRSTLTVNDEKHNLLLSELETCLNDANSDKEFLVRKNEQLTAQLQSVQEVCNTKAESMVSLEMELNDTKSHRDTLCNESRQVIDHVKCWLEEQRKINLELSQRIKHKNDVIAKLKEEIRNLFSRLQQSTPNNCECTNSVELQTTRNRNSNMIVYPSGHQQSHQYSMQVIHSPPPPQQTHGVWSLGSTDSAPCSFNDESDWEGENGENVEPYRPIWVDRVESLTEELQRRNNYWKTRMSEHQEITGPAEK